MKYVLLLLSLVPAAFGQFVNIQQPAGTYTDDSIVRRDGTGNRVQNSGVIVPDSNLISLPALLLGTSSDSARTFSTLDSRVPTLVAQRDGVTAGTGPGFGLLAVGVAPQAAFSEYAGAGTFGSITALSLGVGPRLKSGVYDGASWFTGIQVQPFIESVSGSSDPSRIDFNSASLGQTVTGRVRLENVGRWSIGRVARPAAAWGLTGALFNTSSSIATDSSTVGSGTAVSEVFSSFRQPTLAATNANVTTTNAATVYIANSPIVGTNQTITNNYALWLDDGVVRLDGLVQNSGGTTRVSPQFDKSSNTSLTAITGLTSTLEAGKRYGFEVVLYYSASAAGGQKYSISGTATATSTIYEIISIDNATGLYVITSRQTALAGSSGQTGATAGTARISGTITVNAAGTITPMFAQNASSGTSSILVGSSLQVWQF